MHSSGSTGAPKPLRYTHTRLLHAMTHARPMKVFISLPIYHAFGMASFFHAIWKANTAYLFNAAMPQTHITLLAALRAAAPQLVCTVPYGLKLLAEKQAGVDVLKECRLTIVSGSRCPDELGDGVTAQGVRLGAKFGSTEVAFLFSSANRPLDDDAWNYLAAPPHVAPYVRWKKVGEELYECVVLDRYKGKVVSNSDDPPGSFHSADLFTPHPVLKDRWKFVARIDDRITLLNGEKVFPLGSEGRIRQEALVKEAVMFGIDRAVPGLLLWSAEAADGLADEEVVERIWPAIEEANARAESFAQITREMVAVLPVEAVVPMTDKSSIKRAQVYRDFKPLIDAVYARLEGGLDGELRLGLEELERWIMEAFEKKMGISLQTPETDFFFAGVDSLRAIQMRGIIVRNLDLGGRAMHCSPMFVFDCGNTVRLARFLYALQTGEEESKEDDIEVMQGLIEKYSIFEPHKPDTTRLTPEKASVVSQPPVPFQGAIC